MITISTRDYTTEQLNDLARAYLTRLTRYTIALNAKNRRIVRLIVRHTRYVETRIGQGVISGVR